MNLLKHAEVSVRLDETEYRGVARVLEPGTEEQAARLLLASKYEDWEPGKTLSSWARGALPVAIELVPPGGAVASE
jgi:hypothetical protein